MRAKSCSPLARIAASRVKSGVRKEDMGAIFKLPSALCHKLARADRWSKGSKSPAVVGDGRRKLGGADKSCNLVVPCGVLSVNESFPTPAGPPGMMPPADFTVFMHNYQDMVYATAVRLTGNPTSAEDIAQEVFLKAYAHFENLRTSPTAGGWLKTVATNLSLNHLQRYRRRWRFFSELVQPTSEGGEIAIEFPAPETFFVGLDTAERRVWVERALAQLPDHQRVPLVLYHFDNLPYDAIARQIGVSLSKVKTDILRAREALAKILLRSGRPHEPFQP